MQQILKMPSHFSSHLDYSLLKPTATIEAVEKLCKEAMENNYAAVCVPPLFVKKAKEFTEGSNVKVAAVIGFPYGYSAIEAKLAEIILAIVDGADELDMVINTAALKNNDWQLLAREINTILPIIRNKQKLIKIIIECSLLTAEEIIKCCDIYGASGIDYLSLSTGIEASYLDEDIIRFVRKHLADAVGIKLSGNYTNLQKIDALIQAGAGRIGHFNLVN